MSGFGVRQFSLTLMHRMKDLNADRVEDALKEMGASRAELREAHTLWMKRAYSRTAPQGLNAFRLALGPPAHEGTRQFGDLTCKVCQWKLPFWPGLVYEVLVGPDRSVWNQWFVRQGAPKPIAFEDLTPWSCVLADVGASFADAEHVEGAAPQHWGVDFTHEGRAYRARFVYGLLQRVDPR
ncbi:MAG: hypothetical protein ABIS86_24055 [Streptosporangiaceae bacterium]